MADEEHILTSLSMTLVEGDMFLGKWETASWEMANVPTIASGWQKEWGVSVYFRMKDAMEGTSWTAVNFKIEAESSFLPPPITEPPVVDPPVVENPIAEPPVTESSIPASWNKIYLWGILGLVILVGVGVWRMDQRNPKS